MELAIDSTKIALNDASNLLSVLGHENIHMNQPYAPNGTPQWFKNEIQAHNWELNNAAFTGLKDSNRMQEIKNCIILYSKEKILLIRGFNEELYFFYVVIFAINRKR